MKIEKAKIKVPNLEQKSQRVENQRVSAYAESYKGEYYHIEVTKLIPFKNQSRKHFDQESLEELASTIKAHGIRQPLTILPSTGEHEGKYEIISGERRWRAAQMVGLTKVPCIIIHNKETAEEIALIENIQREDLHPLELMQAFQNLLDKKICNSTQELATKLGVNKSFVVETLSLKKLPSETQTVLLEQNIKARKILRELIKTEEHTHSKIINNYRLNRIGENKKLKVLSLYINNGQVICQDNKILTLDISEKYKIKEYLEELLRIVS
jgi:ParB family chromosome partitioning protein